MAAFPLVHARYSGVTPRSLRHIDVGAGANQQIRHRLIVAVRGPVERGGAVALRRVDVGAPCSSA